jgi:hypothetical protein
MVAEPAREEAYRSSEVIRNSGSKDGESGIRVNGSMQISLRDFPDECPDCRALKCGSEKIMMEHSRHLWPDNPVDNLWHVSGIRRCLRSNEKIRGLSGAFLLHL